MDEAQQVRNEKKRTILGVRPSILIPNIVIVLMLATFAGIVWQKSNQRSVGDYEGRIVDRWADYFEGREGSQPRLRLVVETQEGKRLTVKVDPTVYEAAKVGMRIRSRSGQIVLIESGKENER